jgi:hypothetical protein
MKYVRTPGFLIDLRRLPDEHRKLFVQAVHEILRPALDAGAHKGAVPWPRALRIHRIGVDYSMTWSFAGPDGRALFRLAEVAGETVVVWLRVGVASRACCHRRSTRRPRRASRCECGVRPSRHHRLDHEATRSHCPC